eukprot:TRINITY_DN6079_c0_g1_i1.p1 TRINITY_DN6079_c0_g1~~TRINITY_DN6079_c0_g1_i1.p1  ORF type:complete len:491 (-),score=37.15 TRINITY_DN6079_c0_g1_i1:100-1572(-)
MRFKMMLRLWMLATLLFSSKSSLVDEPRPNILLISTDQQRVDTLGCYGPTFAKSPNIDKLASEGVIFTESFAASPTCSSSRASWVSGTQVPVHNVWGNGISPRRKVGNFIHPLRKSGYFAAVLGKTHYKPVPTYDYSDIHSGNVDMRKPGTHVADYLETYLVEQAKKLLRNKLEGAQIAEGQPWYLHLSFVSPHPPHNVPKEWQGKYKGEQIPKVLYGGQEELDGFPRQLKGFLPSKEELADAFPGGKPDHEYISGFRQRYYELANYVDDQVGKMLGFLDKEGLTNNTLVIFTSDHGTNLWDHGFQAKFQFFDASWRVPLIMRGPGLPKGVKREFAAGVDVPTTILAAARAARPAGLNGFDLYTPLLRAENSSPRTHGVAAALLQGLALATRKWKFVYYLDDGGGQLFDRENDAKEMTNLFSDPAHKHIKSRLLTVLLRWRAGLEPINFIQSHASGKGRFSNVKFVSDYVNNLTGMEPEIELQKGLSHIP